MRKFFHSSVRFTLVMFFLNLAACGTSKSTPSSEADNALVDVCKIKVDADIKYLQGSSILGKAISEYDFAATKTADAQMQEVVTSSLVDANGNNTLDIGDTIDIKIKKSSEANTFSDGKTFLHLGIITERGKNENGQDYTMSDTVLIGRCTQGQTINSSTMTAS